MAATLIPTPWTSSLKLVLPTAYSTSSQMSNTLMCAKLNLTLAAWLLY